MSNSSQAKQGICVADDFQGFLTGKFCADSWWWGLIALTRSIAMNLAVAVAVDAAHVQRAVLSFVFLVYLCCLVACPADRLPEVSKCGPGHGKCPW